jgi:hypothetical protein
MERSPEPLRLPMFLSLLMPSPPLENSDRDLQQETLGD